MYRFLGGVLLVLLVAIGMIVGSPKADRQSDITVGRLLDPPQGYSTVVCSNWVNPSDLTDEYECINAPTGYHIEALSFLGQNPNADQTCTVRFWLSSTDSASIFDLALTLNFEVGSTDNYHFPIKCHKVSVDDVAATDDYVAIAYCKPGSMS